MFEQIISIILTSSAVTGALLFVFKRYVDRKMKTMFQRDMEMINYAKKKAEKVLELSQKGISSSDELITLISKIKNQLVKLRDYPNLLESDFVSPQDMMTQLNVKVSEIDSHFQTARMSLLLLDGNFFEQLHITKNRLKVAVAAIQHDLSQNKLSNFEQFHNYLLQRNYFNDLTMIEDSLNKAQELLRITLRQIETIK